MIEPNAAINAVQVGLTLTFVLMCFLLIKTWGPSVGEALADIQGWRVWRAWKNWSADEWLAIGIVVGFAGNILDNVYWGLTWLAAQFQWSVEAELMRNGPLSNIFARQAVGIVAVYCHLRAAYMIHDKDAKVPTKTYFLVGAGLGLALLLLAP